MQACVGQRGWPVPPPFSPPAAEHLDTSGQLQRRKTKAKPSWAEMDLVLCSWETGEIFLSLDRSRRFRSADCREKSRCVTAEDLVPKIVASTVGVQLILLESVRSLRNKTRVKVLLRTTRTREEGRLFRSSMVGSTSPLLQNCRKERQ